MAETKCFLVAYRSLKLSLRSPNRISHRTTRQPPVGEIEKSARTSQNQNFIHLMLLMDDNIIAINFNQRMLLKQINQL
jgi:hypothetical protein